MSKILTTTISGQPFPPDLSYRGLGVRLSWRPEEQNRVNRRPFPPVKRHIWRHLESVKRPFAYLLQPDGLSLLFSALFEILEAAPGFGQRFRSISNPAREADG